MIKLSKETILNLTVGGLEIHKFYNSEFKEVGKAFRSSFRPDKSPSASIFKSDSGKYLYKDFAEGTILNAIDFVMKLKNIDFYGAMKLINKDLQLGLSEAAKKVDFVGGGTLEYWAQYEVTSEVLKKYKVQTWEKFKTNNGVEVYSNSSNPIFSFKIAENAYKIYRPLASDKKFKHQWVGQKPREYCNVFGISQLPEHCTTILITEGLKDCIVANSNLNEDGIWSIGIDNVATGIDSKTLELLKSKCDNLVLSLDIDEKGLEGSSKKSTMYGLRNFILPSILKDSGGKDIADWFQLKLDKQVLLDELEKVLASPEPTIFKERIVENPVLQSLLMMEKLVKERASQEIVSVPPLIERDGIGIIRKGTICSIQGKFGSHKSRLGEGFCGLFIEGSCLTEFLGFKLGTDEKITVCYIDTERNTKDEFPQSIKSILHNACSEQSPNFRFTSIKNLKRNSRLNAIKLFLNEIRANTQNHLFVVLDVVTDCISNFNDATESLELYDYIGNLAENSNATFLLIIHENPNSDKARGHLGTEGANKASTVMSIGFEKNRSNEETDLIRLKFVKLRSAKKPETIYLKFDDRSKGLVLASTSETQLVLADKRQKADIEDIVEFLGKLMIDSKQYSQGEIVEKIQHQFGCSVNTAKNRLKEIEQENLEVTDIDGSPTYLKSYVANGKPTVYQLTSISSE